MARENILTVDDETFEAAWEAAFPWGKWRGIEVLWDRRARTCMVNVAGSGSRTVEEMAAFISDVTAATVAAASFPYNGYRIVDE